MAGSTDRLVPTPDDHSDVDLADKTTWNGPAGSPVLPTPGAGPGRHHIPCEEVKVPAMAKRTRGFPGSDSRTRISAVTITPASSDPAAVPATHTSA